MALQELFGSDIGLLSVFTIGAVLVIGGFYVRFFAKQIAEEEAAKR